VRPPTIHTYLVGLLRQEDDGKFKETLLEFESLEELEKWVKGKVVPPCMTCEVRVIHGRDVRWIVWFFNVCNNWDEVLEHCALYGTTPKHKLPCQACYAPSIPRNSFKHPFFRPTLLALKRVAAVCEGVISWAKAVKEKPELFKRHP